jgi:GNAT superfamily N-acetyltransferase
MAYTAPEPLRGEHSVGGFESGEDSLDEWLARHARTAEATGSARVFVTTQGGKQVVGYYTLAAGQVSPLDATARLRKGQPGKRPVPVVILARLAVDRRHQGQGLGRSLLQDAMLRCLEAAEKVGIRALVAHAIDEQARGFYLRFGFEESPTDPLHVILLIKDLGRFLAEVEDAEG